MPLERRPLFNPRLLRARLEGFVLPDPDGKRMAAVKRWRVTLDSGRLERTKETQLQGQFLIDFPTSRKQTSKALKADIPVKERNDWEEALGEWQADHTKLAAQLVATEEEINDRVYRLYGLSKADIALLEEHAEQVMINYAFVEPQARALNCPT